MSHRITPQPQRPAPRAGSPRGGYTLLEMLVALTIFAVISVAATFALTTGLRSHHARQARSEHDREARLVLACIASDLRWAYASAGNMATRFIATGSTTGDLLTLSTLTHRLYAAATTTQDPTSLGSGSLTGDETMLEPPQSSLAQVTYRLDADTHTLTRTEVAVPPSQVVVSVAGTPVTLSSRVASVTLEYGDASASVRTDWDYETLDPNASATSTDTTTVTQTQVDTVLPTTARITLEMRAEDGSTTQYQASVAIAMPTPQPIGQKPPAPATPPAGGGAGG